MNPTENLLVKRKIQQIVFLHAQYVYKQCGLEINKAREEERIYNEYVGGHFTTKDLCEMLNEYLREK